MTEKLKQKFNEEIKNLPKESQDAINSSRWEQITEEISKKYLLTDNELNDFQLETALMLLGLTEGDFDEFHRKFSKYKDGSEGSGLSDQMG